MVKDIEFQECLDKTEDEPRHLILGNGFSIAVCGDFNYKSLKNKLEKLSHNKYVDVDITPEMQVDYEEVLNKLHEKEENDFESLMQNASDYNLKIKKVLINLIANVHPENYYKLCNNRCIPYSHEGESSSAECDGLKMAGECKFVNCKNFLYEKFIETETGKIFTFNYDCLLYWVIMREGGKIETSEGIIYPFDDGFRADIDNDDELRYYVEHTNQNIYYLHGALHIYRDGSNDKKIKQSKDSGGIQNLYALINSNLDMGKGPIFVAEADSDTKKDKILSDDNICMKSAFRELQELQGNIFIHGHSLDENDNHVFDEINKNENIRKIFVSYYDNGKNNGKNCIKKRVERWENCPDFKKIIDREYFIYDVDSAGFWDTNKP